MVLRELALQARARGIRQLIGVYRPTDRNGMVKDHYARLGFRPAGEAADGSARWSLDTATDVEAVPMIVRRTGLHAAEAEAAAAE
jgi:predicted enzyme involved in methoxymalonyl-ACP biosynthesis